MIDLKKPDYLFFVGIGGIGMSALALWFIRAGYIVAGYDRTETPLTRSLAGDGCAVLYRDEAESLPAPFADAEKKDRVLVVYTPAVKTDNNILTWFRTGGYSICKRSEILGEISKHTDTIAVAGTHGKTTVSTMAAHLLKQSHVDCSAFLGGISKNYGTNLITGSGNFTVMEADEYDRSFHRLSPLIAAITSLDADHLDIYGDRRTMIGAYNEFIDKIRPGGSLVASDTIVSELKVPKGVEFYTYGLNDKADYQACDIVRESDYYRFRLKTPEGIIDDLRFIFPGIVNIVNLTAAAALALLCGVTGEEIRKAILLFRGVKRRFDIRVNRPGLVYIDDYAHHPEEIRKFVESVREYYGSRKITGIFQPHLFTRTRDHAEGFARILDNLDEVILLPVYPAREEPIEGVSSELIFNKMRSANRKMLEMNDLPGALDVDNIDILVTIGAGDIDRLVDPIEEKLKSITGR